jgi:hypothetical protein
MNIKTRLALILTLILVALLFSCGTNQTDSTYINLIRTQAVATYASSLTETLAPVSTAAPTLKVEQTPTPSIITATITTTPEATFTANPCYNLLWIEDVTIPDGTQMKAGEVFTKTWLVQNIGGCAWHAGFTFQNVGGDPMRGNIVTMQEAIQTGSKREISVQLVVPSGVNGIIQSSWRMADENGTFFGDTLSVNIVVGDVAVTATP